VLQWFKSSSLSLVYMPVCWPRTELIKSSRTVSLIRWYKLADISEIISEVTSDAVMVGSEVVPETSANLCYLTRMMSRKDFINYKDFLIHL
jgi:hypothetical protein